MKISILGTGNMGKALVKQVAIDELSRIINKGNGFFKTSQR
ncbi:MULTISPECIES: hypothetical protein [Paenibacillus]